MEGLMVMSQRPMIGITSGLNDQEKYHVLSRYFMEALCACDALPVMLPLTCDEHLLHAYIDRLDGVLFSGGTDVDPMLFGEYQKPACGSISPLRDAHELALAKMLSVRKDKPVLGVCRGFQVLNIALGGDIYQDISTGFEGEAIAHRQKQPEYYPSHPVAVASGSLLEGITGQQTLMVNSLHHQAVRKIKGWSACATSPDGIVEAAEMQDHPFFLGVQWHPERLWDRDHASAAIFRAFVDACRR